MISDQHVGAVADGGRKRLAQNERPLITRSGKMRCLRSRGSVLPDWTGLVSGETKAICPGICRRERRGFDAKGSGPRVRARLAARRAPVAKNRSGQRYWFGPDLQQLVTGNTTGHRQGSAGCVKSLSDCMTELVAVGLRRCIDFREIDQSMARENHVETKPGHQDADGRFILAECKKLSSEIGKSEVRFFQIPDGLIIFADLPGTDRQLPRPRQRHVLTGTHPLEGFASKAKYGAQRLADQFNADLRQESGSRNRNEVDIPLHAGLDPVCVSLVRSLVLDLTSGRLRPKRGRTLGARWAGSAMRASLKSEFFSTHHLRDRGLSAQSTLMDRNAQDRMDRRCSLSGAIVNGICGLAHPEGAPRRSSARGLALMSEAVCHHDPRRRRAHRGRASCYPFSAGTFANVRIERPLGNMDFQWSFGFDIRSRTSGLVGQTDVKSTPPASARPAPSDKVPA
jgi:hypothetical protein